MADDKRGVQPDKAASRIQIAEHPDFRDLENQDLTEDDLNDIQRLLEQKQDVTRQDITAQDFQSFINRYGKDKE